MKNAILFTSLFALITVSGFGAGPGPDTLTVPTFGKVYVYKKTAETRNVIILISGDGGWKFGVLGFAETFSDMNNLVIGVDVQRYFRNLRKRTGDCYVVAADFVQLATDIEKKYNFPDYRPPMVMGYSSGATLVYGILAQSRPGTFIGGISLGFCPDIELPKMLCQTNGLSEKVDVTGKSYFLQPDAKLGNQWIVLQGKLDRVCNYPAVEDFVKKTADAELITLPNVGHGFSKWADFMPQWKDAYYRLIEKFEKSQPANFKIEQIRDLPVIITNSKTENKETPVALLISGDGGWYGFEQSIADNLSIMGIPTIGVDSKKYFWNRRSPEETTGDMAKLLSYYSKEWGKKRFIIIGYSLGAELVPFIINRLPPDLKSNISSALLLSPATTTDFEIHFSNMLGIGSNKNTYNVIDEIKKSQIIPTLIIFGDEEKTKVPELLTGTDVRIKTIPGDHHYKFNVPLIVRTMKESNSF